MAAPRFRRTVCAFLGVGLVASCGQDATYVVLDAGGSSGAAAPASGTTQTAADGDAPGTDGADTEASLGSTDAPAESTSIDPASTGGSDTSGSSGGESSSTGAGATEPIVAFTDVAVEAGIQVVHGIFQTSPNCLVDQFGPGVGGYCISERMAGASAVGDYNDDGLPDLFFARTVGPDMLYRNVGDGTFTDVAHDVGIVSGNGSSGSVFADFDNDGDQDLYVTRMGVYRYDLFINEGGTFVEDAIARGAAVKSLVQHSPTGVAVGDYDLDGYLDLYVAEWKTNLGLSKEPSHSRLLHNLGAAAPGHFEDVTDEVGVNIDGVAEMIGTQPGTYAFAPSFADLDGDGYPELVVVSDFRCTRLFWNNGNGTFTDGTVASGAGIDRNGMGSTFGDFDGDGDLDWYITAITQPGGTPENRFLRNLGDRLFADMAPALGVDAGGWGWGTSFMDVDNDADLDLMMTAGYYYTAYIEDKNQLWLGEGPGAFGPDVAPIVGVSSELDAQGRGLNVFDYDLDGDQDIFLVNNAALPNLFRNDTEHPGDWLQLRVVGTTSNRDGIGAQVKLWVEPGGALQYREVGSVSHYISNAGREVHFGLGTGDDPIAEIQVYFPASGTTKVLSDVPRNQRITVFE